MLALLIPGVGMGGGTAVVPVEVPDVVGDLQADGTTELETALFVVAVATAYSSSIAAGLIISQDPVGGSFANPGSTVTITVSLGPQTAGGKPKKRKPLYVEIDGETFEVDNAAEAVQLLERAKELAQAQVESVTTRAVKRAKRGKKQLVRVPEISTPFEGLKPIAQQYREDIANVYRSIAVDAEIRALLAKRLAEEDEEDAIFVLLH